MPSDGPENFIDSASGEEGSPGSSEQRHTAPPGPPPGQGSTSDGLDRFERSIREFRPLDLRDAERIKLEKEREELFAFRDDCRAKRRKQDADAKKAEHEASASEWDEKHARKRSLTDLWRDWILLGILIVTMLTGVGTIVVGAITGTTQVLVAGVAILSGTSGSAILGLKRSHPPDSDDQEP